MEEMQGLVGNHPRPKKTSCSGSASVDQSHHGHLRNIPHHLHRSETPLTGITRRH
ncbi:hypothetical protein M407DRAFT_247242, partial [Tulasnella calospora MUT 4182]